MNLLLHALMLFSYPSLSERARKRERLNPRPIKAVFINKSYGLLNQEDCEFEAICGRCGSYKDRAGTPILCSFRGLFFLCFLGFFSLLAGLEAR
jgi:hypothetical protein